MQRDAGLLSLLKDRINKLETQILGQESYSRRDNLIFYGVDEPVQSSEDTFHIIQQILVDKLHIKDARTRIKLVSAHRVGKKPVTGQLPKPRPILVRFMHYLDAVEVYKGRTVLWKQENSLQSTSTPANVSCSSIGLDFPQVIRTRRCYLAQVLKKAKLEDQKAFL